MNVVMVFAIGGPLLAVGLYEAMRKRADGRAAARLRDDVWRGAELPSLGGRDPIWMGFDHGYDPYTASQPSACGETCDISTSAGGDA